MTPEEFAARMREIFAKGYWDKERAHKAADELLCDTLRSLGYGDGVDVYEDAEKWYA